MNRRSTMFFSVLAGVLAAALVFAVVWLVAGRGSSTTTMAAATTTTTEPASTTTEPMSTSTTEAVTTTSSATVTTTTTTAGSTTTTIAFGGDTTTKSNVTQEGSPGPILTDVRWGDHPDLGFVRVVFDFTGSGTPVYEVGYADPPFAGEGSGEEVPVLGTAFLRVHVSPGTRYDMNANELVYTGDTTIDPALDPIVEIQFIDDFEASMTWVIGLTGEQPFTVEVMQDPLRLVIDIAK